jgi:Ca2+-binding RTX toxin-like protein
VRAGSGDDTVQGSRGNDTIWGGVGNDSLFGGQDEDLVRGERGDDTLNVADGDAGDRAFGGRGRDTCIVDAFDIVHGRESVTVAT